MNRATALAIAVNLIAEQLCGGDPPNVVRCMCTYCLEEIDPRAELSVQRAPDNGECLRCGDPVRERMGGLVFVTTPRNWLAAGE